MIAVSFRLSRASTFAPIEIRVSISRMSSHWMARISGGSGKVGSFEL